MYTAMASLAQPFRPGYNQIPYNPGSMPWNRPTQASAVLSVDERAKVFLREQHAKKMLREAEEKNKATTLLLEKMTRVVEKAEKKPTWSEASISFIKEKSIGAAKLLAGVVLTTVAMQAVPHIHEWSMQQHESKVVNVVAKVVQKVDVTKDEKGELKVVYDKAEFNPYVESELLRIGGPEKDPVKLQEYLNNAKKINSMGLMDHKTLFVSQVVLDGFQAQIDKSTVHTKKLLDAAFDAEALQAVTLQAVHP